MTERTTAAEAGSILNGPVRREFLRDEVLAELFEQTARRVPEKVALIFAQQQMTYAELDVAADRVAQHLLAAGVGPGQIVGLWAPRGIDLLVLQLGIAKSGAAWLPFDADTPVERMRACLDDADAAGLLTVAANAPAVAALPCPIWTAEDCSCATPRAAQRRARAARGDAAYVIYTSGSTGKPKGIRIDQQAICHFLRSENSVLGIGENDRVYHGFSVAFDMSLEEVWISYLVGATLWIGPREIVADPDALPAALAANRVSVLHAVPTLLALFVCDVPSLRLINLGGEPCPATLVTRWARPGRRIFNTYGPTEATVSASVAELFPGEPVTIGRPLPNYDLLVVGPAADGELRLLPRGETGELCIAGPGVAAGYLGRPALTAEKFVANPWARGATDARLYRSGDLARIDASGVVHCLGRSDDQVKVRGFRVELGEIEAALCRQAGVAAAAVLLRDDDGVERLVAYLAGDAQQVPPAVDLRNALATALPAYMVPVHYEFLGAMPRLASGKIDRHALRARPLPVAGPTHGEQAEQPQNEAEEVLYRELGKLFPGQAIRRCDDFFADLGGHSLFAARLASALRGHPRFAGFTVGEIYRQRTVAGIAAVLADFPHAAQATIPAWRPPSIGRRWLCGAAQATAIPGLVALRMAQWLAPFFAYHFLTGEPEDSIAMAVAAAIGVFLLATLTEFAVAIAGKWLLCRRLRPGRYPLWGATYFRWWLSDRLIEGAPAFMLGGSPLQVWWLRALGAKIGRDVVVGSVTLRAPELLSIGDGASVGNAVNLENVRVERGEMVVGTITLEAEACIGSYAVLEGDTRVDMRGHLEGQSALRAGAAVPAGRVWSGSPARDEGAFDPNSLPPRPTVSRAYQMLEHAYYLLGALATASIFFLPVFPAFMLIDRLEEVWPWLQSEYNVVQFAIYFVLALPASAVMIACTALISASLRWTFGLRVQEGRWPIHGMVYRNRWLANKVQEFSLNILHGIYATVYAPAWYRLLGAKVGREAEISTAQGLIPDLLTLGDETFIADAVMLGDEEIDGGWMRVRPTVVSRRSFVGNSAYVPDGTVIPENVLIGVHSRVPANEQMRPGDTWLGSPPIHLPAREETHGFPEHLTFRPSPRRRLARGLVEAFRIVAPHALVIAVGYTLVLDLMPFAEAGAWGTVCWYLNVGGLAFGFGAFAFVALLKWLFIGRYDKRSEPMWTPFVWLSEAVTSLYEGLTIPNFMLYLRGTPWLPLAFNLLGCRIGRGVYLDTTDITEFDCATIGDHSELNALCCPQTHLFEDRVMKVDHVIIGQRTTLGPRSTVLYSAAVGDNVHVGPLTLVMKGETLPAGTAWHGCPAAPATS